MKLKLLLYAPQGGARHVIISDALMKVFSDRAFFPLLILSRQSWVVHVGWGKGPALPCPSILGLFPHTILISNTLTYLIP